METIASDLALIELLSNENSILDSELKEISIRNLDNDVLTIDLLLRMRSSSKFETILLRMNNVQEYKLYYNSNYAFYYIEKYKLFKMSDDNYYLSLDPEDESNMASNADEDIIIASSITGFDLCDNR